MSHLSGTGGAAPRLAGPRGCGTGHGGAGLRAVLRRGAAAACLTLAVGLGAGFGLGAGAAAADTLADALAKAYLNSPRLAAERAQLRALDEEQRRVLAQRLGAVEANTAYGYSNTDARRPGAGRSRDDADPFQLGIGGAIPIYDGGRIVNAGRSAGQAVEAGRSELVATEQDVLLAAVQAYEDVRRDLGLVEVARSNVRVITEELRAARDRFEVGEVTRTDVAQAEARLAAARADLATATGSLARSRQSYLVVVGELPGELTVPPPLPDLPAAEEAALALAFADHPTLMAARFAVRQAEFDVKRAIGERLPSLALEGDAAYSDGAVLINDRLADSNSVTVGVRGSVPLWTGGRIAAGVRQAQARLAQRQSLVQDTARLIAQNVSNAWSGLVVARMSITAAREQIRAADIAFEGVREEASLGARTTLDVLNADQELQRARATLIRALRDEYVAGYSLLSSVGSLTVAHLGLDLERYDPLAYPAQVEAAPFAFPRDESTTWSSALRP